MNNEEDLGAIAEFATEIVKKVYGQWPPGDPLHGQAPGFVARVLAHDLRDFTGFCGEPLVGEICWIVQTAYQAAGDTLGPVAGDHADLVVGLMLGDPVWTLERAREEYVNLVAARVGDLLGKLPPGDAYHGQLAGAIAADLADLFPCAPGGEAGALAIVSEGLVLAGVDALDPLAAVVLQMVAESQVMSA